MRMCVSVFAASLLSAGTAFADSDGYFCTSPGYLAFEIRLSTEPIRHELHIVRFGSGGIAALAPIALEEFQVHGMTCQAGRIEMHGWTHTYSIDISDTKRPTISARAVQFDPSQTRPADNLGHLAKPQVIDLEADGTRRFQLVIARVSHVPRPGGIEHHTVTRLVQRASTRVGSAIAASRLVFEGVFLETID